jgi:cell wall-associated NlpC family hydrolase
MQEVCMIRKSIKIVAYALTATMLLTGDYITANAAGISSVLPGGGVNISLAKSQTTEELLASGSGTVSMIEALLDKAAVEQAKREAGAAEADILANEDEQLKTLVIAQVNDYVNVRSIPSEEGEIIGKLYNNSVGTFITEENGWYQITSGSVTGYVKGEFCVTGEEAIALAKEVSTRIATVNTQTLKVRKEPSLDAEVLGLVPLGDVLVVSEEIDGWVKVDVEEGIGWVSTEYVDLSREFVQAESKEEEAKRLAKEAQERKAAREAAAAKAAKNAKNNSSNTAAPMPVIPSGDSAMGSAVAQYAVQFVGNPYVYGGTSLTNGADCSGFVMSVYANFGVSLPHSSAADRKQGYGVDGLANAQPGDLICYSGHVAMYIGNGQIVHASTRKTGIIISNADYKKILAIRRIF